MTHSLPKTCRWDPWASCAWTVTRPAATWACLTWSSPLRSAVQRYHHHHHLHHHHHIHNNIISLLDMVVALEVSLIFIIAKAHHLCQGQKKENSSLLKEEILKVYCTVYTFSVGGGLHPIFRRRPSEDHNIWRICRHLIMTIMMVVMTMTKVIRHQTRKMSQIWQMKSL